MNKFAVATLLASVFAASGDFNYLYNGADWGQSVPLCDTGKYQSPIDLPPTSQPMDRSKDLKIEGGNYDNYSSQIANYGSTIKVTTGSGDYHLTSYDGFTYPFEFAQFHMHAPSEHTRDGRLYDLEMHFVHVIDKDSTAIQVEDRDHQDSADYAVIGVFFDRIEGGNRTNDFLEQLNVTEDRTVTGNQPVSFLYVADFLASLNYEGFYHYDGSFTTPPCTEGVKWVVLNQVQPISDEQLSKFTERWAGYYNFAHGNGNNRMIQPLNDRTIYYSGASALAASMIGALALTQLF